MHAWRAALCERSPYEVVRVLSRHLAPWEWGLSIYVARISTLTVGAYLGVLISSSSIVITVTMYCSHREEYRLQL